MEGGGGTRVEDDSGCRADNTTDIICTGRGTCNCGKHLFYTARFLEFVKFENMCILNTYNSFMLIVGQCECFQRENPLEVQCNL